MFRQLTEDALMTLSSPEYGYDLPARIGDSLDKVMTPALMIDLDAFERNVARMKTFLDRSGLRLRAHAKTHKSADIARYQMTHGGACGICCQKISEAEAMVRAGLRDILISNQIAGSLRADRLARLARRARLGVCVDHPCGIAELANACRRHGATLDVLVEIDVGAGRCGVSRPDEALALARAVSRAEGLRFGGVQAYQGALQHIADPAARRAAVKAASQKTREVLAALGAAGMSCATIAGGGTGSFEFDMEFNVINELQCGSYIFMDADYDRIIGPDGARPGQMENALFIWTGIISTPVAGRAVCDAGLKALSTDSGLPRIDGPALRYVQASDEHGVIDDPGARLSRGDGLRLVPGHCDPTCNLYDWYVCVRGKRVEALWPVTARGKLF